MQIRRKKTNLWPYVLIAPAVLFVMAFIFVPIFNAIAMSLQSFDLRKPNAIAFVGFDNYLKAFTDRNFWLALRHTGIWVLFGVGFQFIFGFLLALLLNRHFRGRGLVRSVSLIPWVTPGVLTGLMWRWMLDGNLGVINDLLKKLSFTTENIAFLASRSTALGSCIAAVVWQGIPFFALMLLAGLQGIPEELYEAADIDGVSGLAKFRYITVPGLQNTIYVTTMLRIIWVSNSVDVIANMTEGGPANASLTLAVYVFQKASTLSLGYASAMAIILTLLLSVVAVAYLRNIFRQQEA